MVRRVILYRFVFFGFFLSLFWVESALSDNKARLVLGGRVPASLRASWVWKGSVPSVVLQNNSAQSQGYGIKEGGIEKVIFLKMGEERLISEKQFGDLKTRHIEIASP